MQQSQKANHSQHKMILLSSLAKGCSLFPSILFSALAEEQLETVNFLLPAIVVYTVQHVCLIALRGFGAITNPYRILKASATIALMGALCVLFSVLWQPLLLIGAILVGIGLSPFSAMYVPLLQKMEADGFSAKKVNLWGDILSLVLALVMILTRKVRFPLLQSIFLLYLACVLYSIRTLRVSAKLQNVPAFDVTKRKPVYFVHALLVLLCLAVLQQYKYSGIPALIYAAPSAVIIGSVLEMFRHRNYMDSVWHTYWIGAVKSFLLVFSLIYLSALDIKSGSTLCYGMLLLGEILPAFVAKPVRKLFHGKPVAGACILLSAGFSFLLLVSVPAVYLSGFLLSVLFANLAGLESTKAYMRDDRHPIKERALAKKRVGSIGNILAQMVLYVTIFLIGKYGTQTGLLSDTSEIPASETEAAFRTVCLICCCVLLLSAALILVLTNNKKGVETNEQGRDA